MVVRTLVRTRESHAVVDGFLECTNSPDDDRCHAWLWLCVGQWCRFHPQRDKFEAKPYTSFCFRSVDSGHAPLLPAFPFDGTQQPAACMPLGLCGILAARRFGRALTSCFGLPG